MNGSAAGVEFALFLLPISIIHYLPNFFFGSLLMLFGVEILADWLIHSYKKAGFHHPQLCQICRAACAAMLVACHTYTLQAKAGGLVPLRCWERVQVSRAEFVLLWATFVAIMLTDLERGILIGIIMAVLYFAYSYAQAGTHSLKPLPDLLHTQEDRQ